MNIRPTAQNADNSIPTIDVQEAFTGGGSQVGQSHSTTHDWELTNNTSFAIGAALVEDGVRVCVELISTQFSPQNFGGTYTFFGGGFGPILDANDQPIGGTQPITSIERYRRTQVLIAQGFDRRSRYACSAAARASFVCRQVIRKRKSASGTSAALFRTTGSCVQTSRSVSVCVTRTRKTSTAI